MAKTKTSTEPQELLEAIRLEKPRWIMAHDHVVFARSMLRKLGWKDVATRSKGLAQLGFSDNDSLKKLRRAEEKVLDDFRVVDMYDAAARHDIKIEKDRKGNWVQKFSRPDEIRLFATTQFSRYQQVEQFLSEQFANQKAIRSQVKGGAK